MLGYLYAMPSQVVATYHDALSAVQSRMAGVESEACCDATLPMTSPQAIEVRGIILFNRLRHAADPQF